jgi:hypothetical protein
MVPRIHAAALTITAAAMVAGANAQTPQDYNGPATQRPLVEGRCMPDLPSGRIVILSQYGGKGPEVPYKLVGSDSVTRVTTVTGTGSDDVVLVLLGFRSTIWDLSRVSNRIKAVYATGLMPQGVAGLKRGTPLKFTHGGSAGPLYGAEASPCPVMKYVGDGNEIAGAAKIVKAAFGRWPSDLHEAYSTPTFSIDGGPLRDVPSRPPASTVRSDARIDAQGLQNGEAGLRQMVASGILAPANYNDMQQWKQNGARLKAEGRMGASFGSRDREPTPMGNMYVVTRNIDQIPEGLTGSHLVTFILPQGVKAPTDANTHSQFLRISGMSGIPQASGGTEMPGASFDRFALLPLAAGYTPHHVAWDARGNLRDETLVENDNDVTHNGSGHQSLRDFLAGRSKRDPFEDMRARAMQAQSMRPQMIPVQPPITTPMNPERQPVDETDTRDMTPTALVAALLFSLGAAGLVLNRRRTGQRSYPFPDDSGTSIEAPRETTGIAAADINPTIAAKDDAAEEVKRLSESLQQAIDLSRDDETALVLLKFKRIIVRAMQEPEYDEDIGDELDAIVERHMAETLSVYVRAAKRTSGARVDVVETNLRQGVLRLTGRIEELVEEQSRRDADRLRQRSDFIRARHPDANDLGDPA